MSADDHELHLDTPRLRAIVATREHVAELQACLDAARDYFARTERRAPRRDEAAHLIDEAEADPQRAVVLLAPRAGGTAVGILDLHRDYPEPGTVHIGLLLLRESFRGLGHGREICEALEATLSRAGVAAMRLSVVDENFEAREFWERMGFAEVGRLERGVTVYEKPVGP